MPRAGCTRRMAAVCSVHKHPRHCDFSDAIGAKVCMDIVPHVSVAVCVPIWFYGDKAGWCKCKCRWSVVLCDAGTAHECVPTHQCRGTGCDTCSVHSCKIGLCDVSQHRRHGVRRQAQALVQCVSNSWQRTQRPCTTAMRLPHGQHTCSLVEDTQQGL